LVGHTFPVIDLAFTGDGRRLATMDGAFRLWDLATGESLLTFKQPLDRLTSSADNGWLVAVRPNPDDGKLEVLRWDVRPLGQEQQD
jgi:WD40 repeat protein